MRFIGLHSIGISLAFYISELNGTGYIMNDELGQVYA